ncbi:MAG: hypothetical protein Q8L34_06610 [Candidatus Woesearchaeota archaeon]|nr:hypothetical protein [Candidatus Woesearchaeota archaeon]
MSSKKTQYEGIVSLVDERRESKIVGPIGSIKGVKSAIRAAIRDDPNLEAELRRNQPRDFPHTQESNLLYVVLKRDGKRPKVVDSGYVFELDRTRLYLRSASM